MATFEEENASQGQVKRLDQEEDKGGEHSDEQVSPEDPPPPSVEGQLSAGESPLWCLIDQTIASAVIVEAAAVAVDHLKGS